MANKKRYVSLENLQTFKENADNLYATKTIVDELSSDVAYIDEVDNEEIIDEIGNLIASHNISTSAHAYIREKINQLSEQINDEAATRETRDAVLSARMDTFTSLADGSTAGDAELADIRVDANGKTYGSAGEAVRGQIIQLSEEINSQHNSINDIMEILPFSEKEDLEQISGVYNRLGEYRDSSSYSTLKCSVQKGDILSISCFVVDNGAAMCNLYDSGFKFIECVNRGSAETGIDYENYVFVVPVDGFITVSSLISKKKPSIKTLVKIDAEVIDKSEEQEIYNFSALRDLNIVGQIISDGTLKEGNTKYRCSNYIKVKAGQTITYGLRLSTGARFFAFYNSKSVKSFDDTKSLFAESDSVERGIYTVPTDGYIRISCRADYTDPYVYIDTSVPDNLSKKLGGAIDFVTPEMFGATGSGSKYDSAAIKSALETGKICVFSGTYRIDSRLEIDGNIHCLGINGNQINGWFYTTGSATIDGLNFVMTKTDDSDYGLECGENSIIENCVFDLNNYSKRNIVELHSNSVVRNCKFYRNATGRGCITLTDSKNVIVENNHFEEIGGTCCQAFYECENVYIRNNTVLNGNIGDWYAGSTSTDGIFGTYGATTGIPAKNIVITGNYIKNDKPIGGTGSGIRINGVDGYEISNNTIIGVTTYSIFIQNREYEDTGVMTINNNGNVYNNYIDTKTQAIRVFFDFGKLKIDNNTICKTTGTTNNGIGIRVSSIYGNENVLIVTRNDIRTDTAILFTSTVEGEISILAKDNIFVSKNPIEITAHWLTLFNNIIKLVGSSGDVMIGNINTLVAKDNIFNSDSGDSTQNMIVENDKSFNEESKWFSYGTSNNVIDFII